MSSQGLPMSQPVLVRGEISWVIRTLRIVVPLVLLAAVALLLFGDRTAGILLTGLVGLIWIFLETHSALLRSKQKWVLDTDNGFDVIDHKQQFHVRDSDVQSLAIRSKRNYVGGELKSIFRQFMIWTESDDEPITLETTLVEKRPDPLATLTTRLWNQVLERTRSDLQAGEPFVGDGWRVDAKEFHWGKPAQQQSVQRHEITACEEFDGQICIWRRGRDDAVAKFPTNGRNVCLLPHLLDVQGQTAAMTAEETDGLGRILFERRARLMPRVLAYIGGCLLASVGAALLFAPETAGKLAGLGLISVGVLLMAWAYLVAYSVFRCRERGVQKVGIFLQQELRYVDVATFTYAATRQYHNGVYVGTHIGMHFIPLPEMRAARINYAISIMNEDSSLDELRNFIARAIAVRMATHLAAGEVVTWTKNLTFLPNGIQYRPQGFLMGRKNLQELSFEDFGGQTLEKGTFYLFRRGEKKPVMSEPVSVPNFFPGYFLLMMLQQE